VVVNVTPALLQFFFFGWETELFWSFFFFFKNQGGSAPSPKWMPGPPGPSRPDNKEKADSPWKLSSPVTRYLPRPAGSDAEHTRRPAAVPLLSARCLRRRVSPSQWAAGCCGVPVFLSKIDAWDTRVQLFTAELFWYDERASKKQWWTRYAMACLGADSVGCDLPTARLGYPLRSLKFFAKYIP